MLLEDVERDFVLIASDAKGRTRTGDGEVLLSYRMSELHIYHKGQVLDLHIEALRQHLNGCCHVSSEGRRSPLRLFAEIMSVEHEAYLTQRFENL